MLKNIGAGIAGYIVMFAIAFVLLTGAWFVFGADGAFEAGQWGPSMMWIIVGTLLGFGANIAGGYTASSISTNRTGPGIMAAIILVMGVVQAIPDGMTVVGRPDNVTMFEAMAGMRYPMWAMILNPIIAVVGVFVGANMEEKA